ncbi:MAG: IS200/IS605 family element transposase accessory protein TnpB [Candidatus Heimdallarchaeota archaeon]|nr:IS200/IS605 family element transposase accessory protein TnpB [Candidatus Heimdallarchaeota archaeon]
MSKKVARIQLPSTKLFEELTLLAKNLYNSATYLVRQNLFKTGKIQRYYSINNSMKEKEEYKKLHALAGAQTPQQLLRMVDATWQGYKEAKNDWQINPEKYLGKPKPPGYLEKNGRFIVVWCKQQVRVRDGTVKIMKRLMKKGFPAIPIKKLPVTDENIVNVRLKPFYDKFILELVYEKEELEEKIKEIQKVLGMDLGVNNLVATSDSVLIKGGVVKSINQFYNKKKAKIQKQLKKQEIYTSKKKQQLMKWRYNRLHDLFHKASRTIINHCIENNINTLVIGRNKNWKQNMRMGRRNNQKFTNVPFHKLIQMIQYKAEEQGIEVIFVTEEYTSQTCSCCDHCSPKNRKYRGLFVCKKCYVVLNADVNAARNIAKKAFPESPIVIGDRGCVAQPANLSL